MPYQQSAPRRIRRHLITYADVCRANDQVTSELDALGFWNHRLENVEVYWTTHSLACYGWFEDDILIPAVSGAQLADLFYGRHIRLTDILRHEWAHAVADKWPELIGSKRFTRAFGAEYESDQEFEHDPAAHVTHYAASQPCEDYAEVFHFYLRHKGRIPQRLAGKQAVARKWDFIAWMAARITAGPRSSSNKDGSTVPSRELQRLIQIPQARRAFRARELTRNILPDSPDQSTRHARSVPAA